MADDEVSIADVYAEVDKRIKAAVDAAKTELLAEIAKKADGKKPFKIVNRPA